MSTENARKNGCPQLINIKRFLEETAGELYYVQSSLVAPVDVVMVHHGADAADGRLGGAARGVAPGSPPVPIALLPGFCISVKKCMALTVTKLTSKLEPSL